ncbi:Mbov_0399 family ICE element protein [Spiroplasma sp. SV19]|uniref:Mbov_0399 family ICE element protein n=1 Tax=Spiroplasma sp. SV19 TaxID=2570468 RepID=UPI0024B6CFFA|nr:hypothetical protein [Spiroplasma sp. SV19]WHQ37051.1 hypothetical protein E7Y35_04030 [Spiroplasma sp. SV19]
MKILLSILTLSMLITTPLLPLSTKQLITMYSSLRGTPFHPDIKITNTDENKNSQSGNLDHSVKETYLGYTSIIWTNYANSWTQFKQYYKRITLYTSGYVDGKSASKNTFGYTYITVANIEQRSSWHSNATLRASGSSYCLAYTSHNFYWGSYVQAGAYYDAIINGNTIKLMFYLWTKGYQYGSGSVWTEAYIKLSGGIIHSSWNLDTIKNNLNNALSNTINLVSDYSGAIDDKRNITDPTKKGNDLTTKINTIINNVLGDEYYAWKQYIQPYSFNNSTRQAAIVIKFINPTSQHQEVWTFTTPIKITLSTSYWAKLLNERLHIMPGQIVNPQDSTKGMVLDVPDVLMPSDPNKNFGGTLRYHTTVSLEFDGALNNSEWLEINGVKVDVLDNKFIATLLDNRIAGETINTYDVIVYHDDGQYKAQYQVKIIIETLIPDLKLKWYAWDPTKNPGQNILITPNLADGKPNPKYDKEINSDTGTKTQIIWVKNKSSVPFTLDPLNQFGEVINPNINPQDYDLGFIAEGAVAGKGVNQTFSSPNITTVYRKEVDPNLLPFSNPTARQKNQRIKSDGENQYWSDSGIWHYVENLSDQSTAQKFMIIGADYSEKYPRFLDVLNNSNIAVDFWTTIHGVHLKNYLAKWKNLNSTDIGQLSYEQVMSYWKEYTSDVIAQRIPPDPNPANYVDITGNLPIIKMNETEINVIANNIIEAVNKYMMLKGPKVKLNSDYNVYSLDGKDITVDKRGLKVLLQNKTTPQYLELRVKASPTSTLLIGTASVQVRNSVSYDPVTVRDLSKIKFNQYKYNFNSFTAEELRNWIYQDVDNYMKIYGYNDIILNQDYGVSGNKIPRADPVTHHNTPGDLNDVLLNNFLNNISGIKTLTLIIYADNASDKTTGYSYHQLINDPESKPVPPTPPLPPNPDANPESPHSKKYLSWLLPVILCPLIVVSIGMIWLIIRKKKN